MSARTPRLSGGGMTRRERLVMLLWDAGKSLQQVSEQTGLSLDYVRVIVARFDGAADERLAKNDARRGSAALKLAIDNAYPGGVPA